MLNKQVYLPGEPIAYTTNNSHLDPVIDAVNVHTHDKNSASQSVSCGGPIPQWGSGTTQYNVRGPGNANYWASQTPAIPADIDEIAINPITGTTSGLPAYSNITYAAPNANDGIWTELARIRGQLAKFTGDHWYKNVGPALFFDAGGSGKDLTMGVLKPTQVQVTTGNPSTPPFTVDSPAVVANLNASFINSFTATSTAGTANALLATNAQGLFPQTSLAAIPGQPSVYTNTLSITNTISDELANIRYMMGQMNIGLYGVNSNWATPGTSGSPSVINSINGLAGTFKLNSGVGVSVTQDSPTSFRVDSTGTAPITDAPTLTYSDFFKDTVTSGVITPSGSNLSITIAGGLIGYVSGFRHQAGQSGATYGSYPVLAGTTNYVWWNGGSGQTDFTVTQSATPPLNGPWVLVSQTALPNGANNAAVSTWTVLDFGRPTVTGSKGGNAALASLLTGLNGMGIIIDATT